MLIAHYFILDREPREGEYALCGYRFGPGRPERGGDERCPACQFELDHGVAADDVRAP